jgi:hypothetical protein
MFVLLLAVGIVLLVFGLAAIGFGIPYNEFGTGNALIMSGSVGVVGGLILVGVAACLRELQRVGRLLERAAPRPVRPMDEAARLSRGGPPPRAQASSAARRAPDQRPEPIPPPDRAALEPERPRPGLANPRPGGDAPLVDEGDVPLSPAGQSRSVQPPRFGALRPRPPEPPRTPRAPDAFERTQPPDGTGRPPGSDAPVGPGAEPAPQTPATPVAILKSGVIDGMGYTLYTDGSIEAQLAEGVVRFASIDELRVHLEKNG